MNLTFFQFWSYVLLLLYRYVVHVQSQGETDDDEGSCVHTEVGPECVSKSMSAGGDWVDCDDNCACEWLCDSNGKSVFLDGIFEWPQCEYSHNIVECRWSYELNWVGIGFAMVVGLCCVSILCAGIIRLAFRFFWKTPAPVVALPEETLSERPAYIALTSTR
jgi:hypothetical protein